MKKISIEKIANITKKIFRRGCVIFTAAMFIVASAGYAISQADAALPLPILMSLFFALLTSVASMVFDIKILPGISKHILFFALEYVILIFLYLPSVLTSITPRVTLYFSVIYIVMYLISAGVYFAARRAARRLTEKRQNYENLFDNANKKK